MSTREEIYQQLERFRERLREIQQDIVYARDRGADLGELYKARSRCEDKIEMLEEDLKRNSKQHHAREMRYDDQSVISQAVVGRQPDIALKIKGVDPKHHGFDPRSSSQK